MYDAYNSRRSVSEIITNCIEYICSMCSGLKLHVTPHFIYVCIAIMHTILKNRIIFVK